MGTKEKPNSILSLRKNEICFVKIIEIENNLSQTDAAKRAASPASNSGEFGIPNPKSGWRRNNSNFRQKSRGVITRKCCSTGRFVG